MDFLYVNNDMVISFEGSGKLTNSNDVAITNATVEVTIYESDGTTEVSGATWPITFTHNGDGEYEATLPNDMEITAGTIYYVKITAVVGGTDAEWTGFVKAKEREF